jgi:hypothetical protein
MDGRLTRALEQISSMDVSVKPFAANKGIA